MPDSPRAPLPVRSTYRLQLGPDLTLDQAAALVPYLDRLGVTHVYCSPVLQAAPGSTHGYDVVDHGRVSRELGGDAAWARFCAAVRRQGMGVVLDIVPNHMAIAGRHNRLWWDLLENGPSSRYATYFDIAWDPPEPRLRNTILVPVLGDHYGRVLERGELTLHREGGKLVVRYFEQEFPIAVDSLTTLLRQAAQAAASETLSGLAARCSRLPELHPSARPEAILRHAEKEAILEALAEACSDPRLAEAVDRELAAVASDPDREDDLLSQQHYRLARWQVGAQDVDYRRFFDIQTLVGLRVEDLDVFEDSHRLVLRWASEGLIDGLRIDHVDGLRDPQTYLERLSDRAGGRPIWVEKILNPTLPPSPAARGRAAKSGLERGELLPAEWPVAGTTGYEAGAVVQQVLLDPDGEGPLTRLWAQVSDDNDTDWGQLTVAARVELLDTALAADLNRLAAGFVNVCESDRRFRDFTRAEVTDALRSVLARFPCYRTYVRPEQGWVSDQDARAVREAVDSARDARPDLDAELFDFLRGVLLVERPDGTGGEFVARFQQTTDPVQAKGIEDTAGYRYLRLAALSEVGVDPAWFGISRQEFVERMSERAAAGSRGLVAAMTHDSKRGEDVRWRIGLLAEVPEQWRRLVERLMGLAQPHRTGEGPDRPTEYLLYQTLIGAWPISAERIRDYLRKAAREAKAHTSWTAPDEGYEGALLSFCDGCLGDPAFRAAVEEFVEWLAPAAVATGLAARLLLLVAPGIPDTYQGSELWDLRLVDPDNRGPVDFGARARLLEEVDHLSPEASLARAAEGLPKLLLVSRALRLRRELPDVFAGAYLGLPTHGDLKDHLVAVLRGGTPPPHQSPLSRESDAIGGPMSPLSRESGSWVVALAPRLVTRLAGGWGDTTVDLPEGTWTDVLGGGEVAGGRRRVADLLAYFPVALLRR